MSTLRSYPRRGVVKDGDLNALSTKVAALQKRVDNLRETEDTLDRLCAAMKKEHERARKDPMNDLYAYVTRDDLLDIFGEDEVILTLRNFTELRQKVVKNEEGSPSEHVLKVNGRFKRVDVRLVTTDGEALQHQSPNSDGLVSATEDDATDKQCSASQASASNVSDTGARRPNRRRKPEMMDTKDDECTMDSDVVPASVKAVNPSEADKELQERRLIAKTLLGYRPPLKLMRRNFKDDGDSYERKYFEHFFILQLYISNWLK